VDIEKLMDQLSRHRITVLIKNDDERMAKGLDAWTVVMSGPGVGGEGFVRTESSSLHDCLRQAFARLQARPGDWSWLAEFA